jgi:hypothetical protein
MHHLNEQTEIKKGGDRHSPGDSETTSSDVQLRITFTMGRELNVKRIIGASEYMFSVPVESPDNRRHVVLEA